MKRPNFEQIFSSESDFCEVSSEKPISSFIPNQALNLSELIYRFERGQRLNVHNNFAPGSNMYMCTDEQAKLDMQHDNFELAPPDDVHDVVDVHRYYQEHQEHVQAFEQKKKAKAQQAQPEPAQPAEPTSPSE